MAAILNTKMGKYEIEDGEVKIKPGYGPLPINKHPITVTCVKIGNKLVVDPWLEEEQVMDARISMAFDDDDNICAIQKGGSGYFEPQQVFDVASTAKEKSREIRERLNW